MFREFIDYFYSLKDLFYVVSGRVLLNQVIFKYKKLAKELEEECVKKGGILTYGEYVQIEQYGENGYHANTDKNGFTDVGGRWPAALARYCLKYNYKSIVEFGCGSGELGALIAREYKKISGRDISWTGVEINKTLHERIRKNFKLAGVESSMTAVTTTLDGVREKNKALVLFPYSLDSIPPEIFLTVNNKYSYPDSILGIIIKDGRLSEELIPQSKLEEKGIYFKDGLFKAGKGNTFDLRSWKLHKGQRAFIPTASFGLLADYVRKMPEGSAFVIIDEFRESPFYFHAGNLGKPRDLYAKGREFNNTARYFQNAGKQICYFPIYKDSLYKFLHETGFRSVQFDIEQKMAAELAGKRWAGLAMHYFTYAFIAKDRKIIKNQKLSIGYYPRKFI